MKVWEGILMVIDITSEATEKLSELLASKDGKKFLKIFVAAYG
jgi:Fe-S cluster assembly iron-binding protein IscA